MSYKISESIKVDDGKTFIKKERMQDIVYECDGERAVDYEESLEDSLASIVLDEVVDTGRWSTHHHCVFKLNDRCYATNYSMGATEMQDESPYEYAGEWIEVTEVVPKKVTVTKYVKKEQR